MKNLKGNFIKAVRKLLYTIRENPQGFERYEFTSVKDFLDYFYTARVTTNTHVFSKRNMADKLPSLFPKLQKIIDKHNNIIKMKQT